MTPAKSADTIFSSLGPRVVTGVLYGVVLLGTVVFGGVLGLGVLAALLGVFAIVELYRMTRREPRPVAEIWGTAAVIALPLTAALWGAAALSWVASALVVAAFFWHVRYVNLRIADTAVVVFGALYVGLALAHLVFIRALADGIVLVLAVLVSVWAGDILAYFVGSLAGSRKLAPRISPKKSWEGFAAGTAGTLGVWLALPWFVDPAPSLAWRLAIGLAIAVAALTGDLFESRIKREAGVKDSGTVLPGHGGVLDRIDSLLPVSVVTYYLLIASGIT